MNKFIAITVSFLTSVSFSTELPSKLTDNNFKTFVKALEPKPGELWRSINWNPSLLNAQAEAAEKKKPLFIWAMDGHPLACV